MEKLLGIPETLHNFLGQVGRNSLYHYYAWNFQWHEPPRKLFMLSHMRSGSSLLTHILNTNPEILGFGETCTRYASANDFYQLMTEVHWTLRQFRCSEKYILDKLLHDYLLLNEQLLTSEQVYLIFLIREPQGSLASLLKLFPHRTEDFALNYYTSRLSTLEHYAQLVNDKKRALLLTYTQLCNQSELVFSTLQDFLKVQHPFSQEYELLRTTGRKFVGDPSPNIQAGKILKKTKSSATPIQPDLLEKGMKAFNQCYAKLSKYCVSLEAE